MIANNAGKTRANRAGGARRQHNWRILVLSTVKCRWKRNWLKPDCAYEQGRTCV
jgi:hypothetical protein